MHTFVPKNAFTPHFETPVDSGFFKVVPEESGEGGGEPQGQSLSSSEVKGSPQRKFKVLVAEDNRADLLLLQEAIEFHQVPIEVQIVSDGEKALDFIRRAEQDPEALIPEILLLDLNLPRRSGLEVLQQVRQSEKFKNIYVIAFTSSDSATDRASVAALGVKRYFRKPSRYDQFLQIGVVLIEACREYEASH